MKELWQPGSYYDGLPQPDDVGFLRIIVEKFATYAMQGVFLCDHDPRLILIQAERPPLLRTRMLNAGRRHLWLPELPMVQLYLPEA